VTLTTAEVRWFFPGSPPEKVWRWFRRGDLWAPQPTRVDEYLVLPGCEMAGVKLREGRFEVKALTSLPVATEYPGGVRGYREVWVKFSTCASSSAEVRSFLVAPGDEWLRIAKRRTLRGLSLDDVVDEGDPREVDARGDRSRRGCCVEITELEVLAPRSSSWWTLGLEGFGESGEVMECLDRGARFVFGAAATPIRLDLDSSLSYVRWLAGGFWKAGEEGRPVTL